MLLPLRPHIICFALASRRLFAVDTSNFHHSLMMLTDPHRAISISQRLVPVINVLNSFLARELSPRQLDFQESSSGNFVALGDELISRQVNFEVVKVHSWGAMAMSCKLQCHKTLPGF